MLNEQKYNPMDNEQNLTLEEEKKELEAVQAIEEEEVREKVIEDYGLSEDDNAEQIDKIVADKLEINKKLSTAIGQKIKHREDAESKQAELDKKDKKDPPDPTPEVKTDEEKDKALDKKLDERDDKKTLDDLNYSDGLKEQIKNVALINNISVKKALEDEYIASKIKEHAKAEGAEEASINRTYIKPGERSASSNDKIPDIDTTTEEGRKEWDEWKKEQIAKGN